MALGIDLMDGCLVCFATEREEVSVIVRSSDETRLPLRYVFVGLMIE